MAKAFNAYWRNCKNFSIDNAHTPGPFYTNVISSKSNMKTDSSTNSSRILHTLLGSIGICILLNYIFLRDIYQPHNTDNTWSLAGIHDYIMDGVTDDSIARRGPSSWVADNLKFFRRTHALIYGHLLSLTGWSYAHATAISAVMVLIAGGVWFPVLKKMRCRNDFILVYIALFFFLEFSFTAANNIREEAFLLLLQSLAFYLALIRQYFGLGLLAAIALETHPIGIMALVFPASWELAKTRPDRSDRRQTALAVFIFLLGIGIGCLYYGSLYRFNIFDVASYLVTHSGKVDPNATWNYGALGQYFFGTKYFRHIPELVLLIFSIYIILLDKTLKDRRFIILALVFSIILSFIRDNFFYAILAYPVFLLVIVTAFENLNKLKTLLALCLFLMVPQYSFIYYLNHGWERETYLQEIRKSVPRDDLPVVGSLPAWFALMDRNYKDAISAPEIFSKLNFHEFYLLEDRFTRSEKVYATLLEHIQSHYDYTLISDIDKHGNHLTLKKMVAREKNK